VIGVEVCDVQCVAVLREPGRVDFDGGHHDAGVVGMDNEFGSGTYQSIEMS